MHIVANKGTSFSASVWCSSWAERLTALRICALSGISRSMILLSPCRHRSHFDHFEVFALHFSNWEQLLVVSALIRSAADEPVAAVVGEDHAVGFEAFENDAGGSGEF